MYWGLTFPGTQKKIAGKKLFNAALCGPGRRELSSGAARDRFPLLFLALGCMHGGCPAGPVLPKWCRLEQKRAVVGVDLA